VRLYYLQKLCRALDEADTGNPGKATAIAAELRGDIEDLVTKRLLDAWDITGSPPPGCNTHYACERWGCQGGCRR
jgi:hypothetical protein